MLKMVVLPAPFGPIRALMLPAEMSNDASCTARRPRNDLPMARTSSSAIGGSLLAGQEFDDRGDRDQEQRGVEHEQVDADVAFAAAQHPELHEELVARIKRPEHRGEAGQRPLLHEEA